MKLSKKAAILSVVLCLTALTPELGYSQQAGGSAVPFLLISPDARASGMGETGTAIADDINAIYWNPAGLGFLDYFENKNKFGNSDEFIPYRQVALSFSPWLPQFNADLFYSYGTIGQFFESLDGTVAFNFIFMNLGEFTRTAENGLVLGKFISNEFSFGLSYGTIVAPDLAVGFQLRYIQSNLTPTSTQTGGEAGTGISASFDLGVLWKPQNIEFLGIGDKLSLGLNLKNVGPRMTYIRESDPLPTSLRLGTAFTLFQDEFNDLKFAVDFAKLLVKRNDQGSDVLPNSLITSWQNAGAEWSFGTEYWYEKIVALRAGYFTEPAALGNRQYWNFGAGVKYDIFKLDFSFINTIEENHPLANTMRFSMLIDWE
jgi:long-subunit fatty acid transport protein